ncbi:MAG: hypothetical protein R3246_15280, partial [Acidimicrobiia bacterium]|nr:hypothetical protein [Acidimicrobiia bacterium]
MSTSLSTRVRGRHLAEPSAVASGDAWIVGAAVLAILMLWWASYFPGLMTVDSFQAWKQIEAGVYQDLHPVFHTWV